MSKTNNESTKREGVEAIIKYVVPGEKAIFNATDRDKSYWPPEEHTMFIENMRPYGKALSLEASGFELVTQATALKDAYNSDEVRQVYYPEIASIVKNLTGAEKVLTFSEIARSDDPSIGDGRLPSFGAHVDYQEQTVHAFAEELLGKEEAAKYLKKRVVFINLWRPLSTVYRSPLAVCDSSTMLESDLNDSEIRGGLNDPNRPSMWGYNLSYNSDHRWYYVPEMKENEILAFKIYDSDSSRVQGAGHTAFTDPSAAVDAPPRESLEIRTIAFI